MSKPSLCRLRRTIHFTIQYYILSHSSNYARSVNLHFRKSWNLNHQYIFKIFWCFLGFNSFDNMMTNYRKNWNTTHMANLETYRQDAQWRTLPFVLLYFLLCKCKFPGPSPQCCLWSKLPLVSWSNLHWLQEDYLRHPKKWEEYFNDKKGINVVIRTISGMSFRYTILLDNLLTLNHCVVCWG